jgi:hypothetical protein
MKTDQQFGVMHAVPKFLVEDEVAFSAIKQELSKMLLRDIQSKGYKDYSDVEFVVTPYSGELGLFANEQMLVRLYVVTK